MVSHLWPVVALMILIQSSSGFSYSASTNGAGYSEAVSTSSDELLVASTAIGGGGLSNTISGKGALHENHFVANGAGATAQVRADLINADNYTYSYELVPGVAESRNSDQVQASESLDVSKATYIRAEARAFSPGLSSSASTEVIFGSLLGYSNSAVASPGGANSSQRLEGASGDIQAASDSGSGRAKVSTVISGRLTGYEDSCVSIPEVFDVLQAGHIEGSFFSTSAGGSEIQTRDSNYGRSFDLNMRARLEDGANGPCDMAEGVLGYDIDPSMKIQDAVDAARPGDIINIAAGTYYESVIIGKSLSLIGAGVNRTVVDSRGSGRVFYTGSKNASARVYMSGMTVQNGKAGIGAGVYNGCTLTMENCSVSGNSALSIFGGGFFNAGTLVLKNCNVSGNRATDRGGGISNPKGKLIMENCTVSGNDARMYGGGICSENIDVGSMTLKNCTISGNSASFGGGLMILSQYKSNATIDNCIITGNKATDRGGGIYWRNNQPDISSTSKVLGNSPDEIYPAI